MKNMLKPALLCTVFFFAFSFNVHAQETSPFSLTVEEAVQLALTNNISIKRNEITLNAKKRSKNTSWNSISPSLSAGASYSRSNEHFDDNYSMSFNARINLSLSANLYSDIQTASLEYEAGVLSFETASRNIERSVRTAFYNLIYSEEVVKLKEANVKNAKDQWDANKTKYQRGFISQLDVLTSQVNYEKQRPDLENARITYENNLAEFKHSLGIGQEREIILSGTLNDFINLKEVSIENIEPDFPALKALEKNLEIAKANLLARRFNAYGPVISAGWSYQPSVSKSYGAPKATDPTDRGSLSLSVTLPLDGILPWSKSQNNISSAKDSVKDFQLQIEDTKISTQLSVEADMKKIRHSIETIKALKSNIDLADRTYQMTLDAYNRGSRDLLSLQSAQNSLKSAQLDIKNEAYSLICTILNLESTLGIPFGTLTGNL